MTVYEKAIHVGVESSYGAADPTFTRSFESRVDGMETGSFDITARGIGSETDGPLPTRHKTRFVGGTGRLETFVLTKGMGMLFKAAFATSGIGAPNGGGYALQTFGSGQGPAPHSTLAVQVARTDDSGERHVWNGVGGVVTKWELQQGTGDEDTLNFNTDLDFKSVVLADDDEADANYLFDADFYDWTNWQFFIDESEDLGPTGFSVSCDYGYETGKRRPGTLKRRPVRPGSAGIEASIDLDYESNFVYEAWTNNQVFSVRSVWSGPGGHKLELIMPACKFGGGDPNEGGAGEITTYGTVPIMVLNPGGGVPRVTLKYTSTDIAH